MPCPIELLLIPYVVEAKLATDSQDTASEADTSSTYLSTREDVDTEVVTNVPEAGPDASDRGIDEEQYQYQVSSLQLCQVSPYFDSMFRRKFKEAIPADDGKYYIEAEDFNPEAIEIAIYAAHSQYHNIPEDLSLHTFCHIALVADYYQMTEPLRPCRDIW
jgi:hypothetical protein